MSSICPKIPVTVNDVELGASRPAQEALSWQKQLRDLQKTLRS